MNFADRLAAYARMIDAFLTGEVTVASFSSAFFREFQHDPGGWSDETFDALNDVATACECYTPLDKRSGFDLDEAQLRAVCTARLRDIRRLQQNPGS